MKIGIVGLPGSGRTTIFNALSGLQVATGPGGKARESAGAIKVPDSRIDTLAHMYRSKKKVFAEVMFVDVATGEGKTTGLPTQALQAIGQCEALVLVLRGFENPALGRPPDPVRELADLKAELILADLQLAESALDKAARPARSGDADAKARGAVLERALEALNDSRPVRTITDWSQPEQAVISSYGLVTAKRVLYVANVGEDDLAGESEAVELVRSHAASSGGEAVAVSGKLEAELAELDDADRLEMLEALGLTEPAIGPVARGVCRLLGLAVFYTTSPKEIRAWTVSAQATAPQAAGVVHSDLQRGFIRAECYSVDDLVQHESEKAIRAAGRLRTEGKNSRIRDGDVMRFLFSV